MVDVDGANLIENDTYLESDIKMFIDGIDMLTEISEDTNQSGKTRKVILVTPIPKKGDQVALLTLNETITDTILINLTEFERKDEYFTYVLHKFNTVLYNGVLQTLNSEYYLPRIAIVKE